MSEDIEMFILRARQVPSNLLKVEMIIYIGKWNVCPDRSQGNKIIITFRETESVLLLEGEKSNYIFTQCLGVWGSGDENNGHFL